MISFILLSLASILKPDVGYIKIVLQAEKEDFVTIYYSDSSVGYGTVPLDSIFSGNSRFKLKGFNQKDTLLIYFSEIDNLKSLAIRLGENHKIYGKRLQFNKIKIVDIQIQNKSEIFNINKDNFLKFFDWNVYVDNIEFTDQIDIYTKQWYHNIHPYLFLDTDLSKPEITESFEGYIELDLKTKNQDVFKVSYSIDNSDSPNFNYFDNSKILVSASEDFKLIRLPINSSGIVRNIRVRMGYFGRNEFYLKSIKIKSGNRSILYSDQEIPKYFSFNQYYFNKMPDILSYKLESNFSSNQYSPIMRSGGGIRYRQELLIDKAIGASMFLLMGLFLFVITIIVMNHIPKMFGGKLINWKLLNL